MRVSYNYEQDSTYLIYIYTLDFSINSPRGLKVKLAAFYCNYRTDNSYIYIRDRTLI